VSQQLRKDDKVVEELRKTVAPVFVPLNALPDHETIRQLRDEFPRMLFLAPRPPTAADP
jgi:tetrahydromethanopterin S-methyltransferase subunit B